MSGTVASPSARQPTRRLWELLLLVFAWLIGVLGFLQIQWANGEGANAQLWLTVTVVGVLALVSHGVVQWKARYADPIILPLATLLTMLGLIMIHRLDVAAAHKAEINGNPLPSPDVYAQLTDRKSVV